MSLSEIIEELPKLSVKDRSLVWEKLEEITEADVPASFQQGMKDLAQGRHVEMEKALFENPPQGL